MKTNRNEKGIALVMAIIAALLVSISAAIVLNMTYRSFYLSVFQTDHAVGFYAAESGVQYAESRLEFDAVFAAAVKAKGASTTSTPPGQNLPYIVTSLQSGNPVIDGNSSVAPDERTNDLVVLGPHGTRREVTVWIKYYDDGRDPPYKIRVFSSYGNI